MKRFLVPTKDNSFTLYVPELNEHYHSINGAITESEHIYINAGLDFWIKNHQAKNVNILEYGLGTGLNAYLSILYSDENHLKINYTSLEKYPLTENEWKSMNYSQDDDYFSIIHKAEWGRMVNITNDFNLKKINIDFREFRNIEDIDIIFFDAFNPDIQPQLWTENIFSQCFNSLRKGGILLTYSVKGTVKRALKEVGFNITKIEGPPGKREILRAYKL